jgi:uncharacterized RDD family membrane protein YckC
MLKSTATLPLGAVCARHGGAPAVAVCERCGSFTCERCLTIGMQGQPLCRECQQRSPVLAEVGSRFVANLVDNFAFFLPFFGALLALALMGTKALEVEVGVVVVGLCVLAMLGVLAFQLHLSAQSGQSIGKRLMRIRVVRMDGSPASVLRILLLRNVVPQLINAGCNLFGLVDALFILGRERRCLHDLIADTIVVKVDDWPPGGFDD